MKRSNPEKPTTDICVISYATPDPRISTGSGSTDVGAGCSRHSTGTYNDRATRVPSHPVYPKASSTFISTDLALGERTAECYPNENLGIRLTCASGNIRKLSELKQ